MTHEVAIRPTAYDEPATKAILSDEHAASSYGQPVLIFPDGTVAGPGDYAYTFGGNHPLVEQWNDLVLPIIDEICAAEAKERQANFRPVLTACADCGSELRVSADMLNQVHYCASCGAKRFIPRR